MKGGDITGGVFEHIQYYNYSQYKKLLFCVTPDHLFYSYLVNHRLHQGNTNQSKPVIGGVNPGTSEPIVINTHHTQYYGKCLNNGY